MLIKLDKIISCSSEHSSYPAANLLEYPTKSGWRCAKPNQMLATVIFQVAEASCITGLEIGNYRCCVVIVTASTSNEPDNWIPIVNHQFLTHDEAANGNFRDQVQIFTKKELNPDVLKLKFDRIKITCMQSANPREIFGLEFVIFRTEVIVDLGLDVFGRFKLKDNQTEDGKSKKDQFKEKYLKLFGNKQQKYKDELKTTISESGLGNFKKRQSEERPPPKRPMLEKLEAGKAKEVFGTPDNASNKLLQNNRNSSKETSTHNNASKPVARTLFGDVIPDSTPKNKTTDTSNKRPISPSNSLYDGTTSKKPRCSVCESGSNDQLCKTCGKLPPQKPHKEKNIQEKPQVLRPKKLFQKLFEDVSFALSGYVNPQRDEIRRKALKMGARYVADPNKTNNKCSHLICAFKNTPKSQQLKGHCKIVSHKFIEHCYDYKIRLPWRRYALNKKDKDESESEEEIEGSSSPITAHNPYDEDTDEGDY